jgi:hypothetical protein
VGFRSQVFACFASYVEFEAITAVIMKNSIFWDRGPLKVNILLGRLPHNPPQSENAEQETIAEARQETDPIIFGP